MTRARILATGTAVPKQSYTQDEIFEKAGYTRQIIRKIFTHSAINRRHLAIAPEHVASLDPQWFSNHYEEWAPRLALDAARQAIAKAGMRDAEIDYVVATSCTGYLCPGISQRLARDLGLSATAKTANLVGMGCNAMVPALERATEFAERHPGKKVLCVATEICSATYWVDDADLESAVGNAIFADGASAAVVSAGHTAGTTAVTAPTLVKFASRANRELINYMGFRADAGRLRVLLSRDVPEAVLPLAEGVVHDLLAERKLMPGDVKRWIVHPGGRKILELMDERWRMGDRLESSWQVLANYGNMSSATVLFVLEDHLKRHPPVGGAAKELAILLAMGPGLSVEGALLEL